MTTPFRLHRILLMTTAAGLLVLNGCATRGYQRAAATSSSLEQTATSLERAQGAIEIATTALVSMVNQPQQDLRPAYTDYGRSVSELEQTLANLQQRGAELDRRRAAYLTTWDERNAEIQNPEIRDASLQRQREVTEEFARAEQAYKRARETLEPLVTDFQDIRRLLSVDLTAAGVATVRDVAAVTRDRSQNARQVLERVAEEFRAVSATLDPQTLGVAE